MDRNSPMLLVDYGPIIVRRDAEHEISFKDLAAFKRCASDIIGYSLDDKVYLCYVPAEEVHFDSVAGITKWTGNVSVYDNVLLQYDTIKDRQADPLYGLTGQALADKQAELAALAEYDAKVAEIVSEQDAAGVKEYTPQQVKDYIDAQIAGASTAEEKFQVVVSLIKKLAVFVLRPEPPNVG